jgi:hypothetical protein
VHARYGPASAEQTLGALPVVAAVCRRLDIAGIVDRAAPVRQIAHATHGQVIVAMIANRLTSPTPMVHLGQWARQFAVEHAFAVAPEVLNDDRIARALDALAPVLDQVTGSVGAAAIASYGIDVSQLHWDMTSISLHGDYPITDDDFARPRFGHPKDRRPDLKQIQAGVATAADGSVPVFWRPYDGGAAEVSQVVGTMQALRRLAGPRRFLLVGDSKTVVLHQHRRDDRRDGGDLPGPGVQSVRARAGTRRLRHHRGHRGGLRRRPRHPAPRRPPWPLPVLRGHHDHHRAAQTRPHDHPAAGLRALLGPRRSRRARPGQETRAAPATT